jgi:hypothetical protein
MWLLLPLSLDQKKQLGDFDAGELAIFLSEGENSIAREGTLDGDQAFRSRCERRAKKRRSPE